MDDTGIMQNFTVDEKVRFALAANKLGFGDELGVSLHRNRMFSIPSLKP